MRTENQIKNRLKLFDESDKLFGESVSRKHQRNALNWVLENQYEVS